MRENSVHRGIANDDPLGFEVPFVAMYLVAMYIFIYLFVYCCWDPLLRRFLIDKKGRSLLFIYLFVSDVGLRPLQPVRTQKVGIS